MVSESTGLKHDAAANFSDWLLEAGRPEDPALLHGDEVITFGALRARVQRVAGFIHKHTADHPRPRIVIMAENSIPQVAAYLGVLAAGAIAVPLPPLSPKALLSVLAEVEPALLFASRELLAGVQKISEQPAIAIEDAIGDPMPSTAVDPEALALLLYTSGSTGTPRGVMLSSRNLQANASSILSFLPLERTDRGVGVLPFYYCYGASVLHTHLRAGASVLIASATHPSAVQAMFAQDGVTGVASVPSLFQLALERGLLPNAESTRIRYLMISGGRLNNRAISDLVSALPRVQLFIRYGVTELTAAASYLPPDRLSDKLGSIGKGLPDYPLRVELENGAEVRPGSEEIGEIVVSGDNVSLGYFKDEAETQQCFRTGVFRTGDLAKVDEDGFIFVVGRQREFIKTAGHRVSPQEIEEVIAHHPDVASVGVCGVPHRSRGEGIAAAVIVLPGRSLTTQDLWAHCATQLPIFKIPSQFSLVSALPQTRNGKLDRIALLRLLTEDHGDV